MTEPMGEDYPRFIRYEIQPFSSGLSNLERKEWKETGRRRRRRRKSHLS